MRLVFFFSILFLLPIAVFSQPDTTNITVYYFHGKHRCSSCIGAETSTLNTLASLYPEEMINGKISFLTYNFEDKNIKTLVKKYKITSSTLLIMRNDTTIDLTKKVMANGNFEIQKNIIKETIDALLK